MYSTTGDITSLSDWQVVDAKPAASCPEGSIWNHNFSLVKATPGYYRLVVGNGTDALNTICRAASDVFAVQELPDNIITDEEGCIVPFEEITFLGRHKWAAPNNAANANTGPIVGDLDGDGIPEIITISNDLLAINIIDGSSGTIKASIPIPSATATSGWYPVMTAVLVDADRNGLGEIILATSDLKLTSYEARIINGEFTLEKLWDNTFVNPVNNTDNHPQPIVTDFNGDGIPEVLVYNQIYNAVTGQKLGETEAIGTAYVGRIVGRGGNQKSNFISVGDFDGDGLPEVAAGGKVYKVTISADGNSATSQILYQIPNVGDGFTAVADLDLDGELDVVVVDISGTTRITAWSPKKQQVIHQFIVEGSTAAQGYPFIGDIDGVKDLNTGKYYPEICLVTGRSGGGVVHAYKYNSSSGQYTRKWAFNNSDSSGGTGITLFDFNNDGINELVYRDQDYLYILNGIDDGVNPVALASFRCTSGTAFEFPVIADIDGSGSAKICVTCNINHSTNSYTLNAYESGNTPWAPTRKIWNQVNYDPVTINNDLTVPTRLFPKQSSFWVNGEEYNPYNGALVQVPIMDEELSPVVQAADPYIAEIRATRIDETTVRLSAVVGNRGIMNADSNLPVSFYKNTISSSNLMGTKLIGITLSPGEFVTLDFADIDITDLEPDYVARVQDNGTTYPVVGFLDCTEGNNTLRSGPPFANDDRFVAYMNKSNDLDVTANDVISTECTSPAIEIITGPKHGTADINGVMIEYIPDTNYMGKDTLSYKLSCDGATSIAYVYLNVIPQPDNISDADCYLNPETQDFTIKLLGDYGYNGTEYLVHSMSTPLVADLVGNGPEIVVPRYDTNSAVSQWGRSNGLVIVNVIENMTREITTVNFATHGQSIAIADVDGDGICEIFIQSGDNSSIYCYDPYGNPKTGFTTTVVTDDHYIIQLADLNADGKVELIAGPYIFDAQTGNLLLKMDYDFTNGAAYGNPHTLLKIHQSLNFGGYYFMPAIGDVDGDGYLEIVAGGVVYKPKPDFSGFTTTEVNPVGVTAGFMGWLDGPTILVDFDNDGELDVCVIGYQTRLTNSASVTQFYVWNPRTREIIANAPQNISSAITIPYVGDLDGNGFPDVAFATNHTIGMMSYQYDDSQPGNISAGPTASAFAETAGFTLFDFNQDGKADIVYRGTTEFFIVNQNDAGTGYENLTPSTTAYSGTVAEYPIVADVDGDGQAEIILTRAALPWSSSDLRGMVSIFKSADPEAPWAPARGVWNQWSYNGTLINDDMTVPQYAINPATIFPGEDGQVGTEDDTQPYNGFLMQQTALSKDGVPLFLTPNAVIPDNGADIKFDYNTLTDVLTIKDLKISNEGDAILQAPIKIAIYKETIPSSTQFVYTWNDNVSVGDIKTVPDFDVPGFSAFLPSDAIRIRINDNGDGYNYQPVCDSCCVDNGSDVFVGLPLDAMGWADSYRKCIGESVVFTGNTDELGNDAVFSWYDSRNNHKGTGNPVTAANLTPADSGQYILKTEKIGTQKNLSLTVRLPFLSVAPEILRWKSNTTNSNWNDLDNWNDNNGNSYKAIPAGCTEVHLPAVATYYPSFDTLSTDRSLYDNPLAGTIVYHYGAETPYPHLLTYNKAKVQYNFGYYNMLISGNQPDINKEGAAAKNMKRDTWYPLATPLKKMASGDFSLGGYPYTWQALSDLISGEENFYTIDFSKSSGKNDVDLSTTNNSIVVKIPSYQSGANSIGFNNHKHLQYLQGVLEIPYFENVAEEAYHPGHSYNRLREESNFYYFDNETLQQLPDPVGTLKRGEDAYRFVFEKDDENDRTVAYETIKGEFVPCYTMTVSPNNTHKHVLVGNPFMATINMKNFYEANSEVLEGSGYYSYDGAGGWNPYTYDIANGVNSLQAFVVVFKTNAANQQLYFPLEGTLALTGTATGAIPVRAIIPGSLQVNLHTASGRSADYAGLSPDDAQNDDPSTQVELRKLINVETPEVPEVFFVSTHTGNYNLVQLYTEAEDEVSVGIRYAEQETELTLSFEQIDEFSALTGKTPVLVDKLLTITQDLSRNNSYTFIHKISENKNATDVSRFAIRFEDALDSPGNTSVKVTYKDGQLMVEASSGIVSVKIYSLSGQLIYESNSLNEQQTIFTENIELQKSSYLVNVSTNQDGFTTRKIVVAH